MKNAGIAMIAVNNKNERILKNRCKGPWSNDVPSKILLFQFNEIGTAAKPSVQTTMMAALCFDFSSS